MELDNSWFESWIMECMTEGGHADEKRLLDRIYDLSEMFEDMLFRPDTNSFELIKCQSKQSDSNEWVDSTVSLPDALEYFDYTWFHPIVEPLEDCGGYFDEQEQVICLPPESIDDDRVVMHEMIHLHEFVINEQPMFFHDMLLWALYTDLRNRIPKLDEIITGHAHALTGSSIYWRGGTHDILFLLKSFDLDIRKGWPLGTVFGYGKDDEFESYTYETCGHNTPEEREEYAD